MRVVFLVPYRSDQGGRRDELWEFVEGWLDRYHMGWEIYTAPGPDGPFNRGAAINTASALAGDWDVAIVHDADNIADPDVLYQAVARAHKTKGCVFPFKSYVYLDEFSSNRLMRDDNWFIAPLPSRWAIAREHCSGVQCLSRTAYDQIGGFIELEGWGYEDCITGQMLKAFTTGIEHLSGGAYHLWHPRIEGNPETTPQGMHNRRVLGEVLSLSVVPDQLREYLKSGGHPIP